MSTKPDLGDTLFAGTAKYYSKYRFKYPLEMIAFLVERFKLDPTTHVLDLGCGTGKVAIPLSKYDVPIHAVDPDIDMLSEGIRAEAAAGASGVAWYRGSDSTLSHLRLPTITLAVMAASFHWTEREKLLVKLDELIALNGGVSIIDHGQSLCFEDNSLDWSKTVKEVVRNFLGSARRAGQGIYQHPVDRHEIVLSKSPFNQIEMHRFSKSIKLDSDHIIGLTLSTSFASPVQLGGRIEAFQENLREKLLALSPSDCFPTKVECEVLVGTRT